jgi:DNA modification methylase
MDGNMLIDELKDKIFCEDCLVGMKRIPDKSVDAIICDLPYGVLNKQSEGGSWDSIIPFEPLWKQYNRVVKPNAAIVLFAQGMFTAKLIMSQPKLWRYNLIWDKVLKSGFLNSKRMPLRQHEDIVVFYDKLPTYNPQMTKCEPHKRNHSKGNGKHREVNRCYGNYVETPTIISDEKFPTSIISVPKEHINGKSYHPTEKPVDLIRYLIRTYTNEGETVLDNCMGSGTTAIAAMRENRHFIGFELNKEYFDKACERIRNEQAQLKLQL